MSSDVVEAYELSIGSTYSHAFFDFVNRKFNSKYATFPQQALHHHHGQLHSPSRTRGERFD